MKRIMFFALLAFIPLVLDAAVNVDSIFLWDNDRGFQRAMYPSVGSRDWGAWILWQDTRWGDNDIYRQGVYWNGEFNLGNTMVSIDSLNMFQQSAVDVEGTPYYGSNGGLYVAAWEDSSFRRGNEKPTRIMARRWSSSNVPPFEVYYGSAPSKLPSVSCRDNGWFVVTYTNYDPGDARIWFHLYDEGANLQRRDIVCDRDGMKRRVPISRVAYCDSGFVVVYEDSVDNGSDYSIYMQYRSDKGDMIKDRIKVSFASSDDSTNEQRPAVAVNKNGFVVVVWEDYRDSQTRPDIFMRPYQMRPGLGTIVEGAEETVRIANSQYNPRVTVFPNNEYFVVYNEYTDAVTGYDIYGQFSARLGSPVLINGDTLTQRYPDIENRNSDSCYITWVSQEVELIPGTYTEIICRPYRHFSKEGLYPLISAFPIVPDTVGGRKGWYFDDENYDDPLTAWNEDPIDEPDSIYVDLDFAILDQIQELNTNNQYLVTTADTLPIRKQKALGAYEAIFMDLGYRTDLTSAGTMTQQERKELCDYINARNPTMIEGNDFGYLYGDTVELFKKYGATYMGDGAPYLSGNIDTLFGWEGSFKDETLLYNYKSIVDNYVDSISAKPPYQTILRSSGAPSKWFAGRCVGWGTYYKKGVMLADTVDSFKVYSTFMLSSIKGERHPHTYAEFYRRLLCYLGLNCQPEPITAIICSTYTGGTEGVIMLKWKVVSDNAPTQSAEGPYKLKFAKDKMTSESAFDNAPEYYQTWSTKDSAVGVWRRMYVSGLPPAETLVVALKVSDEDTLWDALGAEPQVVVSGDTLTPHTIGMGSSRGYFKDFLNRYEYINQRRIKDSGTEYDSLFVTWDGLYFYVGFARCDFRSEGDLFIYVDTRAGMGADSTVDYNGGGSLSKSYFDCNFRPDYCLIIENETAAGRIYKKWVTGGRAGSWQDVGANTTYHIIDGVINNYLYTEIRMPFDTMAYSPGSEFKLMVIVQNEASNEIINAYPIFNPLGSGVQHLTQYYSWGSSGLQPGKVPARRGIIGLEETAGAERPIEVLHLTAMPNPFSTKIKIVLPTILNDDPTDASLKIYDVTGRLVKSFSLCSMRHALNIFWDGTDDGGRTMPGGVYFCEFALAEKKEAIKLIYIK